MEWAKIRQLGREREGQFDSYQIAGRHYERGDGEQGWRVVSRPANADAPKHELWVAGKGFKSARQEGNRLRIGERVVSVHSAEMGAIIKAIRQWEYEEPEGLAYR